MTGHLLAVDVGNSRIKLGLFDATTFAEAKLPVCLHSAASALDDELPWDELRKFLGASQELHALVAGVNPAGVRKVLDTWPAADWPRPHLLERSVGRSLRVKLAAPEKVGIDRLLNAVAVNLVRPSGHPAIIVDTGTATTVDYVNSEGEFAGGAILPGFALMARALHEYTALLPLVSVDELATDNTDALGLDTRHALRSGLFWGQLGAVKELVSRYSALTKREPLLFLTGGGASLLAKSLNAARFEPHLSLQGLAIILSKRLGNGSPGTTSR